MSEDPLQIEHPPFYIIGDVHGQLKRLLHLLQAEHLIDSAHHWIGKNAVIWFVGDLVDRGPDGIGVVELVMHLQREAPVAGGQVASLLGNHEMMLLAAYRFGRRSTGLGSSFIKKWRQNGGQQKDIASLTQEHLEWFANLPAMALHQEHLLIHADAPFYIRYGRTIAEVNEYFKTLLKQSNALEWEDMLDDFARRGAFHHPFEGEELATRFLSIFGGQMLVHGHTPISFLLGSQPKKITAPMTYANGKCTNVDGGIYMGGPGFLYKAQ